MASSPTFVSRVLEDPVLGANMVARALVFIATAPFFLLVVKLLYDWRQPGLRKIPGPALASVTDLWRFWHQCNGQLRGRLVELHRKHGPVVRYGVRSVSVSDPGAIDTIYGKGFKTADSYKVLVGISNGKEVSSLVSTADEARHAALRRAVAAAFSPKGVLEYEPFVDETIVELLDKLRTEREPFDLSATVLYYTMDAAGRFSFGEPLGCLRANGDVGGSIQTIRDRFDHWGRWSSMPWLERLVYRNTVAMRMSRTPSSMAATAVAHLKARMGTDAGVEAGASGQPADLLARFIEASQAHPDVLDTPGVVGMLMSTISGAGDTTATAVTAVAYLLMKNRSVLAKLRQELGSAGLSKPVPRFSEVSKLPYLHAVIREGMRVVPSSTWPIERRVPAGGVNVAGVHIPEGTSVGTMVMATHLSPAVFGDDAHEFRPERWLTGNAEELRRMDGAFMGFSRGKRVCLGQHIAILQMKKVLSALVREFELSPAEAGEELEFDMSPAVVCAKPFYVKAEGMA